MGIVNGLWLMMGLFVAGPLFAQNEVSPPDRIMGEQYPRNGRVPPPREIYSVPSVRALPLKNLWARIEGSDKLVAVGLKDREPRGYFQGKVLVSPQRVMAIQRSLLATIPGLRPPAPDERLVQPVLANGRKLPVIYLYVESLEALAELLRSKLVEYVEPVFFLMDSLACTQSSYAATLAASADGADPAGDIVPYPYTFLGIPAAWARATTIPPGAAIGIAAMDSGASLTQDQLNGRFPLVPQSSRPPAVHLTAAGIAPGDQCGHGTRIAGLASAPKDGRNIVGVAWAAPLTTIKITNSPIVFGGFGRGSVPAICDAISKLGSAQVVSMAFGMDYTSPTVERCIQDSYRATPQRIFVAAGGTTFAWVVFPAEMPEVVAVSLVEINPATNGFRMFAQGTVAYGAAIDFVVPVTRDWVAATGIQSPEVWSLGGSSSATALVAGMISVIWSQYPGEYRGQIMNRLRNSASLARITDSGGQPIYADVGLGIPNAYLATGGSTRLDIEGPMEALPGSIAQLTAKANGTDALTYEWLNSNGTSLGTGAVHSLQLGVAGTTTMVTLVAVNRRDGNKLTATHSVESKSVVTPTADVRLYSANWMIEHPVFLDGSSGTHILNGGVMMPAACSVIDVNAVRICHSPWRTCTAETTSAQAGSPGWVWGFRAFREPWVDPRDLQANIRWWHDGFTEIRVRAVYTVRQPAGTNCSVPGKTQLTPI